MLAVFEFSEAAAWLAAAHGRGLIERRQPPIEHAEIIAWSAVAIAARRYAPSRAADSQEVGHA